MEDEIVTKEAVSVLTPGSRLRDPAPERRLRGRQEGTMRDSLRS